MFLNIFCTCKRQTRTDICDDVVLAFLVFNLEVVFGKAKDPAYDPGGRDRSRRR